MANHSDKSVQREVNKMTNKVTNPSTKGSITPDSVVPKIPKTKSQRTSEEISKPKTKSLPHTEPKLNKITPDINLPKSPKVTKPKGTTISQHITKPQQVKAPSMGRIPTNPFKENLPKSLEERAKSRSEAGKKAWQTRVAKMTPEQLQEYKQSFAERMRQARAKKAGTDYTPAPEPSVEEPPYYTTTASEDVLPIDELEAPTEESYYPTLSIIDAIRDKIANLERDVDVREIPLDARKNTLLSMFDEHVASLEGTPAMKEYLQYLEDNADIINHHLDTIKYFDSGDDDSVYGVVDNEFGTLARLLIRRPLMPIEAESMSYLSEYSNNY